MLPKVTICVPVRDRAWILPYTLASIEAQSYPMRKLAFRFICHNCTDNSWEIIREWSFSAALTGRCRYFTLTTCEDDTPPDGRTSAQRDGSVRDPRHAQARLKNLLKKGLGSDEWFFFFDSDILLAPDALSMMVAARKDIVGGLANVLPGVECWNYFPRNSHPGAPFVRDNSPVPTELVQVGLVAGLILYSPRAHRTCDFNFQGVGEDEGAIRDAERRGFSVWLEPRAIGEHVMRREDLADAVVCWEKWVEDVKKCLTQNGSGLDLK